MSNLVAVATVALLGVGGVDAAFFAVFGVFVAAFLVLAVVTLRWAVRRDRVGRTEWLRRQDPARPADPGPSGPVQAPRSPSRSNGHGPRRRDQRGQPGTRA